jgi:hypothetical protein
MASKNGIEAERSILPNSILSDAYKRVLNAFGKVNGAQRARQVLCELNPTKVMAGSKESEIDDLLGLSGLEQGFAVATKAFGGTFRYPELMARITIADLKEEVEHGSFRIEDKPLS